MKVWLSVMVSLILVALAITPSWAQTGGESECGSLKNHYGPFDYRTASTDTKRGVESYHFTPKVENLIGGQNTYTPGGDMAYTLHVFPNHHRALMALIKLAKKQNTAKPQEMRYSVACYFDRAERFAPNDGVVKSLYGIYLLQIGRNQDATKKLEDALEFSGENANMHYNLGLAYFEIKEYDKALASAHTAYQLGFQLPGLRSKLEKVGKWKDLPAIKLEQEPVPQDVNPQTEGVARP